MKTLTDKFVNNLIVKGIIKDEDKEIYSYGFRQMLVIILNLFTVLVLGIIFNQLIESILFMITYIPIRVYAGGYHARTHIRCYIFSFIMLLVVLYILKIQLISALLTVLILTLISSFTIILLAPIEDENKPLDELETKIYSKRAKRNLLLVILLLCLMLILNKFNLATCICISLVCNIFMLILGKINNFFRSKYIKNSNI